MLKADADDVYDVGVARETPGATAGAIVRYVVESCRRGACLGRAKPISLIGSGRLTTSAS